MKSKASPQFWRLYYRLPLETQRGARKAYQLWRRDPRHPSLRFKRVSETRPTYSVRIQGGYRVLGLLEGDTVTWFWIGRHDEYRRLLK